jgi:thiol-disulfide isomerase/thioredoxin
MNWEDYIKNSSLVNYGIDLNDCSRPDITKKFNYGIVWPPGGGGYFLASGILSELGYRKHYQLDRRNNEYHSVAHSYFTDVDNLIRGNFSKEIVTNTLNKDLDKLSIDVAESIFCGHWLPVSILSNTNIHIKHLTYIRYSNWVRKALVHIKRLLKTGSEITTIAFLLEETIKELRVGKTHKFLEHPFRFTGAEFGRILKALQADYSKLFRNNDETYILYFYAIWCIKCNFDMYDPAYFQKYILSLFQEYRNHWDGVEKEQQAIDYIKSTGKVDHFEVRDYNDLFFDLNTNLPISKTKIVEYSKKNLELIDMMATYIPDGTIKKELYIEFDQYNNRMKEALHE